MKNYSKPSDIIKYLRKDNVMEQFLKYADNHDIRRRNNMILKSQHLLERAIYGNIIYSMLDMNDYLQYINRDDKTILKAIEIYKAGKTRPKIDNDKKKKTSKASQNLNSTNIIIQKTKSVYEKDYSLRCNS